MVNLSTDEHYTLKNFLCQEVIYKKDEILLINQKFVR